MLVNSFAIFLMQSKKNQVVPLNQVDFAYMRTNPKGHSTACIIALREQGLHAINLGDSGFKVVRDGCTVFRSPVQKHDFCYPYLLESGNGGDLPSFGKVFIIPVAPGLSLLGPTGFSTICITMTLLQLQ